MTDFAGTWEGTDMLLIGKEAAAALLEELRRRAARLHGAGISPTLAVVAVGQDPAAENYIASITRRAQNSSVELQRVILPETCTRQAYLEKLAALNADPHIHGILPLLPLPEPLSGVQEAISPEKDVDGVTALSAAGVYLGRGPGLPPCTAEACLRLLAHYNIPLQGKRAAVVGRSAVIGKPVAMLLLQKNATVTVCHSKTEDLPSVLRQAEIIIAAAGCRGLITADCINQNTVLVDVGANWDAEAGRFVGDADYAQIRDLCRAISPVPGGVGPLTSAVLMEHVIRSAENGL